MLSRNAFDNIVIKGGIRPGHGGRGQLTCFELLRRYVSKQKDTIMDSARWNRRVTRRTDMKLWAVAVWGWGEMGVGLTTSTFYVSCCLNFYIEASIALIIRKCKKYISTLNKAKEKEQLWMTFTHNEKLAPYHNHLVHAHTHCPIVLHEETKGHPHNDRFCWETRSSKHW